MERLRTARKASFRDTDTSTKLSKFLKYCLSQPATLPVFGAACIALGAAAGTGAELGGIDATTLTCGLAAGVRAVICDGKEQGMIGYIAPVKHIGLAFLKLEAFLFLTAEIIGIAAAGAGRADRAGRRY